MSMNSITSPFANDQISIILA